MLVALVPCVILTFGLFFIPESPRWLVRKSSCMEQTIVLGFFIRCWTWIRQKSDDKKNLKWLSENFVVRMLMCPKRQLKSRFFSFWLGVIFPNIWSAGYFISITLMHNFSLTGLCNNPWTTPKTQSDRFVSEDVLALSHCKIFIWTDFWLRFTRTSWPWSIDIQHVSDICWTYIGHLLVQ